MIEEISSILEQEVDIFGFVSTKEYIEQRTLLEKHDLFSDFSKLDGYQTIITLGLLYPSQLVKWKKKGYGILSRYSYGKDYHLVFKEKLRAISSKLEVLGINHHYSVDTGFIDERYASYLSQMGYLGKNQFLITKDFGSYLFLATILVDIEIPKSPKALDDCGTCRACIDACPSNALDHGFEEELCISYLTQAKKPFDNREISYLKTMVYGCDICQRVCPKNKAIDFHLHPGFEPTGVENIDLLELLDQTNKEYEAIYGENASSWKGALVMKRNAICLLANQGITEAIPKIESLLEKHKDVTWFTKTAEKALHILRGD